MFQSSTGEVLKGIRKVCQLTERCDGHGGYVKVIHKV